MKKLIISVVMVTLCLPYLVSAGDAPAPSRLRILIKPKKPGPGDIVTVTVKGASAPLEGRFGDKKIHFYPSKESHKAVFGVDLYTKPGKYKMDIITDGKRVSRTLAVGRKTYPMQKLTLPKGMVELSPEDEARAEREQEKVAAIWPSETDRAWEGNFINPREGEISTKFGLRRIINGIPKNSHSGVDIASDEGKEVYAPNNGMAVLVDDHFFSGQSLFLDHGQGIYTMFFHLSRILVKQGQQVKKGEVIGLVGSTGRSTGPHLHWGVRMQGARVDPLELITLDLE